MNGFLNNSISAPVENVFGAVGTRMQSTLRASAPAQSLNALLGTVNRLPSPSNSDGSNECQNDWHNYAANTLMNPNYCQHLPFENYCSTCSYSSCDNCIITHIGRNKEQTHEIVHVDQLNPPLSSVNYGGNGSGISTLQSSRSPIQMPLNLSTPPPGPSDAQFDNMENMDNMCVTHYERFRWVCENCKQLICQQCTLNVHSEHIYTYIEEYVANPQKVIEILLTKGEYGKQQIKDCIDCILHCLQQMERECNELAQRHRKNASRNMGSNLRNDDIDSIIDAIEKYRHQKNYDYTIQTKGLRDLLASIATITDVLKKIIISAGVFARIDLARELIECDRQIESYLKQTSGIDIRKANVAQYVQLQQGQNLANVIGSQSSLYHSGNNSRSLMNATSMYHSDNNYRSNNANNPNRQNRRPIVRGNRNVHPLMPIGVPNSQGSNMNYANQMVQTTTSSCMHGNENMPRNKWQASEKYNEGTTIHLNNLNDRLEISFLSTMSNDPPAFGRCIFNLDREITVVQRTRPVAAFCPEGSQPSQVSRAWGICVDRDGNIIVGDRRNNRIQVFNFEGKFKFAFGSKGSGDGQLELPAGVTVDRQNRIIVADKDNHRIQIFSSSGRYLLKFGTYGFGLGQFQYPWDVAVDSNGNIVVTDTRNYRLQMFNSNGHFITKYSFDNSFYQTNPKSRITPRGVCFTPDGNILVTDFENGRIMKLNHNLTSVSNSE